MERTIAPDLLIVTLLVLPVSQGCTNVLVGTWATGDEPDATKPSQVLEFDAEGRFRWLTRANGEPATAAGTYQFDGFKILFNFPYHTRMFAATCEARSRLYLRADTGDSYVFMKIAEAFDEVASRQDVLHEASTPQRFTEGAGKRWSVEPRHTCDLSAIEAKASGSPLSIAVIDFAVSERMQEETGRALGDLCRDTVQSTNRFIQVDRENIVTILGEHDFASAVKCDETKCVVRYGRILRVQKVLTGRVSSLGQSFVVYLSLTDVESARIEGTTTSSVQSIDLLSAAVQELACELLTEALTKRID